MVATRGTCGFLGWTWFVNHRLRGCLYSEHDDIGAIVQEQCLELARSCILDDQVNKKVSRRHNKAWATVVTLVVTYKSNDRRTLRRCCNKLRLLSLLSPLVPQLLVLVGENRHHPRPCIRSTTSQHFERERRSRDLMSRGEKQKVNGMN